jgi:hypothetical protein
MYPWGLNEVSTLMFAPYSVMLLYSRNKGNGLIVRATNSVWLNYAFTYNTPFSVPSGKRKSCSQASVLDKVAQDRAIYCMVSRCLSVLNVVSHLPCNALVECPLYGKSHTLSLCHIVTTCLEMIAIVFLTFWYF